MQKLELTWIGKGSEPAEEPRILLHDASKDYGDPAAENMLIHGDNLLALKALEQEFAGQVKCIYIDPPYNTGSAFEHYDDNLEHSTWLSLMKPRISILKNLLSDNGSIWITLDDTEVHYLKVMADEVFGRRNFLANIIWEKSDSPRMDAKIFSSRHDHILVYAKNVDSVLINRLVSEEIPAHYNKTDASGRRYYLKPLRSMGKNDAREARPNLYYGITTPDGSTVFPIRTNGSDGNWRWSKDKVINSPDMIEWIDGKKGWMPYYKIYADSLSGTPPETVWHHNEVGSNRTSKIEIKQLFGGDKSFDTPKPERLIQHVLQIATNLDDLVLDSFLGSGTTAAVAHKIGRRYIGIELGDHCYTHCLPRLKAVVDGEQGGISKTAEWKGGGGFKFYELAPTLIVKDKYGNPVIDTNKYNPEMLAAAVAKLNGFIYSPDPEVFWKQGKNVENSFIYITTQYLTAKELDDIARDLPDYEKLLICAPAFDTGLGKRYDNIDVRKIPQSVLNKCEFGKDNYNLNIVNPPEIDEEEWDDAE
ncbi:adenine-specific DNA-methyltransferase [Anaerobacterium chartisolvens]|uniref:Adenine-specific DNA-methyltransferase n=1 Tax=Anaerobacterium chartisolvens TaxID=1297424 RepID=A0A369B4I4_9FIRM|nr:site-specific DNA-methyltransferase [Anaerobacterium chartisolvens]RCX15457.1 adenine-specific DNA-methyltransferase [Anaerobacterium chartisolvens]